MIKKNYPVTCHTDHVGEGSTFVALNGFVTSGEGFIPLAVEKGATKIVVENSFSQSQLKDFLKNKDVAIEYVSHSRKALAKLASAALGNPSKKLKIIGITGTKGKTTTAYLVEHLLKNAGYKTALLGSISNKILDDEVSSSLTTPESDYLHMFFHECVLCGVEYVVMEVSSHSIALDRIYGIEFDIVAFTNLASEHMDFHPSMQDYFLTKMVLLSHIKENGFFVVNIDDQWGKRALEYAKSNSQCNPLICLCSKDKFVVNKNNLQGLQITFSQENFSITLPTLFGMHNAYNSVMAIKIVRCLGVAINNIVLGCNTFPGVDGRLQMHVLQNGARAFVDFAHNPSSFEAVLKTLRDLTKNLIVVFGCGGDRDKTKRPMMGKLASLYADTIIVTDDNPRNEDSATIIKEIYMGIPSEKSERAVCIPSRKDAIKKAVEYSEERSIIAILGKGHERYNIKQGKKSYFNDFEEISMY